MPPSGIATVRKRPAPLRKHSAVEVVWASLVEGRRHNPLVVEQRPACRTPGPNPARHDAQMDQPVRRKRGGLLPARWEMLGAPACRISIAGCWSMPAISKLRITGADGLRRTTERLPRDRARARSACKPALSTRMSPVRSSRNSSPGGNSRTASVNRGAVEKSSSPVRRIPLASASAAISRSDTMALTFPDVARLMHDIRRSRLVRTSGSALA